MLMTQLLLGALLSFCSSHALAASNSIEERSRLITERLVQVGECEDAGMVAGRVYLPGTIVRLAYERTYENYLVEVTQDGWFGDKNERLVENSVRESTKQEIETKSFNKTKECEFWVDFSRKQLQP